VYKQVGKRGGGGKKGEGGGGHMAMFRSEEGRLCPGKNLANADKGITAERWQKLMKE
jgi:hypothetical protein